MKVPQLDGEGVKTMKGLTLGTPPYWGKKYRIKCLSKNTMTIGKEGNGGLSCLFGSLVSGSLFLGVAMGKGLSGGNREVQGNIVMIRKPKASLWKLITGGHFNQTKGQGGEHRIGAPLGASSFGVFHRSHRGGDKLGKCPVGGVAGGVGRAVHLFFTGGPCRRTEEWDGGRLGRC